MKGICSHGFMSCQKTFHYLHRKEMTRHYLNACDSLTMWGRESTVLFCWAFFFFFLILVEHWKATLEAKGKSNLQEHTLLKVKIYGIKCSIEKCQTFIFRKPLVAFLEGFGRNLLVVVIQIPCEQSDSSAICCHIAL